MCLAISTILSIQSHDNNSRLALGTPAIDRNFLSQKHLTLQAFSCSRKPAISRPAAWFTVLLIMVCQPLNHIKRLIVSGVIIPYRHNNTRAIMR